MKDITLMDIKIAKDFLEDEKEKLSQEKSILKDKINEAYKQRNKITNQLIEINEKLKEHFPYALILPDLRIADEELILDSPIVYNYENEMDREICINKANELVEELNKYIDKLKNKIKDLEKSIIKKEKLINKWNSNRNKITNISPNSTEKLNDEELIKIIVDLWLQKHLDKPSLKEISKGTNNKISISSISRRLNDTFFIAKVMHEIDQRIKSRYHTSEETKHNLIHLLDIFTDEFYKLDKKKTKHRKNYKEISIDDEQNIC